MRVCGWVDYICTIVSIIFHACIMHVYMHVRVTLCMCVCVCVTMYVRMCVSTHTCVCTCANMDSVPLITREVHYKFACVEEVWFPYFKIVWYLCFEGAVNRHSNL